nr:nascent polypeptide-associated complex subunit alpha, muscle-specific form-like [Gorilla gorilla gorilla]
MPNSCLWHPAQRRDKRACLLGGRSWAERCSQEEQLGLQRPPCGRQRPGLLKSASPDPLAASRRPLRARLFLPAASPGPTAACQQPLWTQRLPISWRPWSAHSFLKPSSPGPGQASRWPLQDQLLPSDGVSRPQMVSGRWAPPRPAWASLRPLQAQVVLKSTSPGPASQQVSKLFWLNSCPAPSWLCRPRTFSSQALRARLLPLGRLYRPSCGYRTASAGPALASQGPLQAQLSPPRRPPGAKSLPASPQPACGPVSPSRWPVDAQLMPLAPCPEAGVPASHWLLPR